jgi:hypothetical protein
MMLRKFLRIGGWSLGSLLVLLAAFIALLAFPGFMFAHETKHANLTLYSDADLSTDFAPVLREIQARLAASTIDAPATEHRIFIGHDKVLFGWLQNARAKLVESALGIKPSLTYNASWPPALSHVVTFRVPDLARNKLISGGWPPAQDTTYLLTHEVTHSLVSEKLGLRRVAALPLWKAEGFPDYVAATAIRRAPGYSLRDSVARLMRTDLTSMLDADGNLPALRYDCIGRSYITIETGDYWNTCYYLSRLLIEYQLDRKGLTLDALMDSRVNDTDTWREMLVTYEAGRL